MAGRRKAEGIALLSVYGGDDDDAASLASGDGGEEEDGQEETMVGRKTDERGEDKVESLGNAAADREAEKHTPVRSPLQDVDANVEIPTAAAIGISPKKESAMGFVIVDYGAEEGLALSPEVVEDEDTLESGTPAAENGELHTDVEQKSSGSIGIPKAQTLSVPPLENSFDGSNHLSHEASNVEDKLEKTNNEEDASAVKPMDLDTLADFLPTAPTAPCSSELQAKVSKYLMAKMATGKSFNEELRTKKGYRNPDFLQSAVRHYDIDHIGSCFRKEVFDPHGYEQGDFYESIAQDIRKEAERKEQEKRQSQSQRVDFVRTSLQTIVTTKPILPLVNKVVSVTTTEGQSIKTDGRTSKRSKWDKVEVEVEVGMSSQAISHAADTIASINAHAALLAASANAGAGYASFAQQQRRAGEKLRASESISNSADTSRGEKRRS